MLIAALALGVALALVVLLARARRSARLLEARLAAASRDLESLQRAFSRFAPHEVVEDVIARGASSRSEKREVAVLFADLKGFTALGEALDAAVLVAVLNGFFEAMSAAIAAHGGHVSKFIGDGLLALFGALEPNPWQTTDAVHAALAMREALAAYNVRLAAEGHPPLAMGVGVHRGPVVAGVIGTSDLVEYGVIGANVNLAARVERLTRVHDVDILVTDAVRRALDPRFRLRAMPPVEVKGLSGPLATFALESFEGGSWLGSPGLR